MKKTIIAILALLMVISMVACNGDVDEMLLTTPDYVCFTAVKGGVLIGMKQHDVHNGKESPYEYSTDKITWKAVSAYADKLTEATGVKLANAGDKVYFRAKGQYSNTLEIYYYFAMEKMEGATENPEVAVSGNIMTMLDRMGKRTDLPAYAFRDLFKHCVYLTDAKDLILPATTLAEECYDNMFAECSALKTAPALPATTLAKECYDNMFYNCIALETAPVLPATTLAKECYRDMFKGCTALKKAPALPAKTLAKGCYAEMFYQCTSLTELTATEGGFVLPATELQDGCYTDMFRFCSKLDVGKVETTNGGKIFPGFSSTGYCYGMFASTKNFGPYDGDIASNTIYYWYKEN